MPPVLQADGWRVHNWRYENTRPFPMAMPAGRGETRRFLEKGTYHDADGYPVMLNREYQWTQRPDLFVTEVTFTDAIAIMSIAPHEFVDVTDMPRSEWPKVCNKPIYMKNTNLGVRRRSSVR